MPYKCRHCGTQVERIRKYCPGCERRMYKGDWIRLDKYPCPMCKEKGKVMGLINWVVCPKCNGNKWIWR